MFPDKLTISHKACLVSLVIAFFKILYQFTWIVKTLEAIGQSFVFDAVFYLAFAAMCRLSFIAVQTAGTWIFMITMLITHLTIHSARGEHDSINIFCWHFHRLLPLPISNSQTKRNFIVLTYIFVFHQKSVFVSAYFHILCILRQ